MNEPDPNTLPLTPIEYKDRATELLATLRNLDAYFDFSVAVTVGTWGIEDVEGICKAFEEAHMLLTDIAEEDHYRADA